MDFFKSRFFHNGFFQNGFFFKMDVFKNGFFQSGFFSKWIFSKMNCFKMDFSKKFFFNKNCIFQKWFFFPKICVTVDFVGRKHQKSFRGQSSVPPGGTKKRVLYILPIFGLELGMQRYTCTTELYVLRRYLLHNHSATT